MQCMDLLQSKIIFIFQIINISKLQIYFELSIPSVAALRIV